MIVECAVCHHRFRLPVTVFQLLQWREGGELIQDVMPDLTPSERELLISRTCESCFADMFKEEE